MIKYVLLVAALWQTIAVGHAQTSLFGRGISFTNLGPFAADVAVAPDGTATVPVHTRDSMQVGSTLLVPGPRTATAPLFWRREFALVTYTPNGAVQRLFRTSHGGAGCQAAVADSVGNVYATGFFSGFLVVGRDTLRSANGPGGLDAFLFKLDPAGAVVWARRIGAVDLTNNAFGEGLSLQHIVLDRRGNIYVGGYFTGAIFIGATQAVSRGGTDVLLAKFTPLGQPVWARTAGGFNPDKLDAMSVDPAGNAFLGISYTRNITIGTFSYQFPTSRATDICVARVDASGGVTWARAAGGVQSEYVYVTEAHPSGDVFIVTGAQANSAFGVALTDGPWLLRLNGATGAARWAQPLAAVFTAAGVDRAGTLYLGSHVPHHRTLNNGVTLPGSATGNGAPFVAAYGAEDGLCQWALQATDTAVPRHPAFPTGAVPNQRITVTPDGYVYAFGQGDGRVVFGADTVASRLGTWPYGRYQWSWKAAPPLRVGTPGAGPLWVCPGSTVQVPFSVSPGSGSNNTFTAELSDAAGSFASPVVVGSAAGPGSGSVAVTLPMGLADGPGYRLRVVASAPRRIVSAGDGVALWVQAAPRAQVVPTGAVSSCLGSPVAPLAGFANAGAALQWLRNGQPVAGATGPAFSPSQSGNYALQAVGNCGTVTSAPVTYTVHPRPVVTLSPQAAVPVNQAPFPLTGGAPAGGSYSGPGVSANTFAPQLAGVGTHTLAYEYRDANGCEASATTTITVTQPLAARAPGEAALLAIYPNPATGIINVAWQGPAEQAVVQLVNGVGQVVLTQGLRLTNAAQSVDCRSLAPGLYYLQVTLPKAVIGRQVVLQP
ncbi:hypothetical protein GCM10023185_36720 [Hymenobacter saemangeumensis]|uniref:Secretion system C-terminal sorting domain-containing protein n=1 Tax=Hymenobacter saemangeumensis TaxID=1084522 RepID=A0ABP8IQI7_9BACT